MNDTRTRSVEPEPQARPRNRGLLALVLLWSRDEPDRVGELVSLPSRAGVLGRNTPDALASPAVLGLERHRPGVIEPTGALRSPHVSRQQWKIEPRSGGRLAVERVGRAPLAWNGRTVDSADARPGDLLEIADIALFRVVVRPWLDELHPWAAQHPFGGPDADGIVGETPAAWELRARIAFVAARDPHALVLGESGTGKELMARALHNGSPRARAPFISRNAATIPDTLVDAELFGNARNYPNVGMPERAGMVGDAHGGTLFLDEIGELPVAVQTHLLRVLDHGEYTRLGEATARRTDLRLVGATNRPPEALRHDVLARLPLRIQMPPLRDRLDDLPLLATHVLRSIRAEDRSAVERFFDDAGWPRFSCRLVRVLIQRSWPLKLRELQAFLWDTIARSPGSVLDVPAEPPPTAEPPSVEPMTYTPAQIQEVLDRFEGNQEQTWRALGLSSRFVLGRLIRRHGLRARTRRSTRGCEGTSWGSPWAG